MKELQRQGETQRERSVHLLAPQVTVSASVRLAQRQELPVCLQWGQWGPNISALRFPGPKQGAGSEAEHLGRRPAHRGSWYCRWWLYLLHISHKHFKNFRSVFVICMLEYLLYKSQGLREVSLSVCSFVCHSLLFHKLFNNSVHCF